MSSYHSSFNYISVEEPSTPPSSSTTSDPNEQTRSARRQHLASDMIRNISRTKSGFVPRSGAVNSRIDEMETELSALRGKFLSMETLIVKYRTALDQSEEKVDRMVQGIAAVIENFEVAWKSSETENKAATRDMYISLKEVAHLVLTRHKKDLSENAQIFEAAISSLRVLTATDEPASNLIEQ